MRTTVLVSQVIIMSRNVFDYQHQSLIMLHE